MVLNETEIHYLIYAAILTGTIIAVRVLFKLSDIFVSKISKRFSPSAIHWRFMRQVNKTVITVAGLLTAAHYIPAFNSVSSALVTSSAILTAAVGLAAQGSMSNIIGGVFISIFKPFAVGDIIKLNSSGISGIVSDINFRHTTVVTPQNNSVLIPNSIVNNEIIENSNLGDGAVCNFLDFRVGYDADISAIRQIAANYLMGHEDYLKDKEVSVIVRDIAGFGVDMRVSVWTNGVGKNFTLCSDMREYLLKSGIKFKSEEYLKK
jgi:small-conductance mechanosensitive channel